MKLMWLLGDRSRGGHYRRPAGASTTAHHTAAAFPTLALFVCVSFVFVVVVVEISLNISCLLFHSTDIGESCGEPVCAVRRNPLVLCVLNQVAIGRQLEKKNNRSPISPTWIGSIFCCSSLLSRSRLDFFFWLISCRNWQSIWNEITLNNQVLSDDSFRMIV